MTGVDQPIRVLLVDDTSDIRLLLRLVLETQGQMVVVDDVGDGRAAIEAARAHQPDVVLLDLAMPVMDGIEALPHVLSASPQSKVIVLSGFQAESMAASALAAGAHAYQQKGATPDELLAAIFAVLGRDGGSPAAPPAPVLPPARSAEDLAEELRRVRAAIASTAHEIRNPVSLLIGVADMLTSKADQLAPAAQAQLLAAIARQARLLDRVTDDLLTASQADRGQLRLHAADVPLRPALDAAAGTLEGEVTVQCPADLVVRADPVRLDQMLVNLVSNARKYGAPPFRVTAHADGERAVLCVDDAGPGVPPEFRPSLFAQFARAEGTRVAGSGVGLFVVRAIAEALGGSADYEPLPEGGSRFVLTLPLVEPGVERGAGDRDRTGTISLED